jgi:GNAT superfamily N-acetyltransferase
MTTVMTTQMVREPSLPARTRSRSPLILTVGTAADLPDVLAMVARCSRATLFRRFHGFTDGLAYTTRALQRHDDGTLVAWCGSTCVGMANLIVGEDCVAHLGVLVEDSWQRHGVGSWLIGAMLDRARAQGVTTVHADVLSDARYLLQVLRRFGSMTVEMGRGAFSAEIALGQCSPRHPGEPGTRRADRLPRGGDSLQSGE